MQKHLACNLLALYGKTLPIYQSCHGGLVHELQNHVNYEIMYD